MPVEAPTMPVEAILHDKQDIIAYIHTKDWNGDYAVKLFNCESGLNSKALNNNPLTKDFSVGIAQINLYGNLAKDRPSKEKLYQAKFNIDYAYSMYKKEGFKPWSCVRRV
jgi:hypothetical protein